MNDGDDEECIEAGSKTLPADNPSAGLMLAPGEGPFRLNARDALCDWPRTWLSRLPPRFRELGRIPRVRRR